MSDLWKLGYEQGVTPFEFMPAFPVDTHGTGVQASSVYLKSTVEELMDRMVKAKEDGTGSKEFLRAQVSIAEAINDVCVYLLLFLQQCV